MTRIAAAALTAVTLLLATTLCNSEPTGKTVAREQAFYETLSFGPALRAAELITVLDRFVVAPGQEFRARYFSGPQQWPSLCAGQFAALGTHEVNVILNDMDTRADARSYYLSVWGVPPNRAGDFGRIEASDRISVQWYHCSAAVSHSLHTTADQKHVLFKIADAPMMAWSVVGGN